MKKLWKGMFMTPHLWESIYLAYRAGYDGCGAMLLPRGGSGPEHELLTNPSLWEKVQNAIDKTGMFLDGIGNCIIDDPDHIHPFGMGHPPDPETLRPYFAFAGKHHMGGVQTSIWTDNENLALESFAKLCDVCADYGLTVNLEFVAWGVCDNLAKARKVLESVNKPNARITLDLMHLYYSSVRPEEILTCPPEWFGEVHICDMPHVIFPDTKEALAREGRSYRLFPGESGIDLSPWLRVIPETAIYVPEIPNPSRMENWGPVEYAFKSLDACKAYLIQNRIPL